MFSERASLEMTYISISPKAICEAAKRASGGGGGRVWYPPPRAEKMLHLEPPKTVSDAYLGQRLLEYDFLQMIGKDDNIKR